MKMKWIFLLLLTAECLLELTCACGPSGPSDAEKARHQRANIASQEASHRANIASEAASQRANIAARAARQRQRIADQQARQRQQLIDNQRKMISQMEESLKLKYKQYCPDLCVGDWTLWSTCTNRCGGGQLQRTRRLYETEPDCKRYGIECATYHFAGNQSRSCNMFCSNGGVPVGNGSCHCPDGFQGRCCDEMKYCDYIPSPRFGKKFGPSPVTHRKRISFECDPGYKLDGEREMTCWDGEWVERETPTCERITCTTLSQNSGVNKLYEYKNSADAYTVGDEVYYDCGKGHVMEGAKVRKCVDTGTGTARWTGMPPTCSRVSCEPPLIPENGQMNGFSFEYGDPVNFTCNEGYKLVGSKSLRCLGTGKWLGRTPTCQQIICNQPTVPQHGDVYFHKATLGAEVMFECELGYELQGPSSLYCMEDGYWNATAPRCKASSCGDPGDPDHGSREGSIFTVGNTVEYTCYNGYQLIGSESSECLVDANWNHELPTCEPCPIGTYMDETRGTGSCEVCPEFSTTPTDGSTDRKQCACFPGFDGPAGGPCVVVNCLPQSAPVNGAVHGCDDLSVGATCNFMCDDGYVLSGGSSIRSCQQSGQWDGRHPICTACPEDTYKSSVRTCSPCPSETSTFGRKAQSLEGCRCVEGYQGPAGGPCTDVDECAGEKVLCEDECRNFRGSFECRCNTPGYRLSDDRSTCQVENQCRNLTRDDAPENGGLVCHWFKQENSKHCTVKCNAGYEFPSFTNAYETCGANTGWIWNYKVRDPTAFIQPCIKEFYEGFRMEVDAAYFSTVCDDLTPEEQLAVREQFVEVLNNNSVCLSRRTNTKLCQVKDTGIICGNKAFRRKRSVDGLEEEVKSVDIVFNVTTFQQYNLTVIQEFNDTSDCDQICQMLRIPPRSCTTKLCVSAYKRFLKGSMMVAKRKLQKMYERNGDIEKVNFVAAGRSFESVPGGLQSSDVLPNCADGMEAKGDLCVPCKKGSFLNKTSRACELCPPGTAQIINGQGSCVPCTTGFHAPEPGAIFCTPCDENHYGDDCQGECRCVHGVCDFKSGNCTCTSGYEGEDCSIDIPGCRDNECFPGVQCHDVTAPGTGFTCGACPPGYYGDGFSCTPSGASFETDVLTELEALV